MAAERDVDIAIRGLIEDRVVEHKGATGFRRPLVAAASAGDPRFSELRTRVDPGHALPEDLLPGARSVVAFFLPFEEDVVLANARDRREVDASWAVAYVETNTLIAGITKGLTAMLRGVGVRAAAEPATGVFDRTTLTSTWSHKSVAVIAGLGSIGLHRMIISDAGCAGRVGSIVIDVELPAERSDPVERCIHNAGGSCGACVRRCPVGALKVDGSLDKQRCWERCQDVASGFSEVGLAEVCGKCVLGPCAVRSAT